MQVGVRRFTASSASHAPKPPGIRRHSSDNAGPFDTVIPTPVVPEKCVPRDGAFPFRRLRTQQRRLNGKRHRRVGPCG